MKAITANRYWAAGFAAAVVSLLPLSGLCASDIYPSAVIADGALGYYRFNDSLNRNLLNLNSGSLGAAGNASNDLASITGGVVHSIPGAIVGDSDRAEFYDFTTRSEIPFNSALNTPNDQPFSVEAWLYPVSDAVNTGMGALCNRYTQGPTRQGWVMYQRAPDTNHCTTCGPGVGWEVRMYNNQDTSGHLDVTSGVAFTLGKWQHMVFVYDPVQVTNATLTIYIDGVPAATNVWAATDNVTPGYFPCVSTNDTQPNGPPAMSLGGYNNANGGTYGFENPWIGGVDEFAWYSSALSPAQVLAHYQNGTNANRSTPYATLIQSDHPVAYLRLNEVAPTPDTVVNFGDLRSAGNGTNTVAVKHPGTSALAGRTDDGSHSGHYRNTSATGPVFASIPWTAENNPDASVPFTVELWVRPTGDQMNPGPSPMNNRVANGITDRTGWVIYQRDPNASYQGPPAVPGESGIGWTFRMYTGNGGGDNDVLTGQPYTMGEWQHLVFTWSPQSDNGPSASGSEQWNGILTAYVDGVAVATNSSINYAANTNPTEDPANHPPADLAIGSYNLASGLGEEFEGDVDEVAIYSTALTADQILAHYRTGTNANSGTNYEALVYSAAAELITPPIPERTTLPATYLRFNEPADYPAANSGALGGVANASLVMTTNVAAGPAGNGFAAPNPAVSLDGLTSWVSLNDPSGLDFSNQITLEAWINPASGQGTTARIISHGPPSPTVYDINTNDANFFPIMLSGSQLSSNEVFLRIEGNGAKYSVGTSDGFTFHGATAAVTAGDLGGANGWIYLAGTYDGTHWNLYRNGAQVASVADAQGALPVTGAEWAIGATGMGWADYYTGGVDEVAIYNKALTSAQIQTHYNSATAALPTLSIAKSGSSYVITFSGGTLVSSPTANGQYNAVSGANSPYSIPASTSIMFYRVKQ